MPLCKAPIRKPRVNQGIAGIDYVLSAKDRLAARYYVQSNPTNNPFGAVGSLLGFAQQLSAGSQVFSLSNSVVLSPNLTWEQHVGFTRLRAYANTTKDIHREFGGHFPARDGDFSGHQHFHIGPYYR